MLRIDVELWVSWHFYVHSFRQTDARFRIKFGWHTTNFRKSGASCCRVVVVSCFVIFTAFDVATYLNNFYVVYSVGTPRALLLLYIYIYVLLRIALAHRVPILLGCVVQGQVWR